MGFPGGKGHNEPAAPQSFQLLSAHVLTLSAQMEENSQTRFAGVLELVWWRMDSVWGQEGNGVGLSSHCMLWQVQSGLGDLGIFGGRTVWDLPGGSDNKESPAVWETWVQSLGWVPFYPALRSYAPPLFLPAPAAHPMRTAERGFVRSPFV